MNELPEYPVNNNEQYLSAIAGEERELPEYPVTRKEMYLSKIAGEDTEVPEYPVTREEQYLAYIAEHGGGPSITVIPLSVAANGTYTPEDGTAYGTVTVVVSGGATEPYAEETLNNQYKLTSAVLHGYIRTRPYQYYSSLALVSVTFPETLTFIEEYTFQYCKKLANLNIPQTVVRIATSAFDGCTSLVDVVLPTSLAYLDDKAFNSCSKLETVTFTSTPITINTTAFKSCGALTTINVPWAQDAVSGAPWGATNATINYNYTGA